MVEDWVQRTLEDQKEYPDDFDEIKDEDQLRTEAYEDHDLIQMGYEDVTDSLTEWMGDDEDWHCEVENFGWQNSNGYKDFRATNGATLLREILPNTDCTFNIWKDDDPRQLRIQNFHHDSPTGNEWYTLAPSTEQD